MIKLLEWGQNKPENFMWHQRLTFGKLIDMRKWIIFTSQEVLPSDSLIVNLCTKHWRRKSQYSYALTKHSSSNIIIDNWALKTIVVCAKVKFLIIVLLPSFSTLRGISMLHVKKCLTISMCERSNIYNPGWNRTVSEKW